MCDVLKTQNNNNKISHKLLSHLPSKKVLPHTTGLRLSATAGSVHKSQIQAKCFNLLVAVLYCFYLHCKGRRAGTRKSVRQTGKYTSI